MFNRSFAFVVLMALGLAVAGCSRGGRSPNWNEQTTSAKQPPPGSGQTGPGMTKRVNQVNGPNDSTY
jgi:hypothetical protein